MWCQGLNWECVAWIIYHLDEWGCLQEHGEKQPCEFRLCSKSPELAWMWEQVMLKGLRRVRGCTQQVNVSRSSHGFPSLPENVGSCTDACLTWAGLQLLGEGRVFCRAGLSQERGTGTAQEKLVCKGCLLFSSARLWVQAAGTEKVIGEPSVTSCPLDSRMDLSGIDNDSDPGIVLQDESPELQVLPVQQRHKDLVPHRTSPTERVFHRAASILCFREVSDLPV